MGPSETMTKKKLKSSPPTSTKQIKEGKRNGSLILDEAAQLFQSEMLASMGFQNGDGNGKATNSDIMNNTNDGIEKNMNGEIGKGSGESSVPASIEQTTLHYNSHPAQTTVQRHWHGQKAGESKGSLLPVASSSFPSTGEAGVSSAENKLGKSQYMMGLTVAGVATSMLVTVFALFHVDVFLEAYRLPLRTFSTGNIVYAVINTANDFLGAWLLDSIATRLNRSDMIGTTGVLFALCFLTPFFRWKEPSTAFWDGSHYILSMSLYDTMYSFSSLLLGSLVTDNHMMDDQERVAFMASGKMANLVANFAVARIALNSFDDGDLTPFHGFLVVLAAIVAFMFTWGQTLTRYTIMVEWKQLWTFRFIRLKRKYYTTDYAFKKKQETKNNNSNKTKTTIDSPAQWKAVKLSRVIRDFRKHSNFWAWIGMEIFLESQVFFVVSFLKTFVDRLLIDFGISQEVGDWILSTSRSLMMVCAIIVYIPIQRYGYQKVYPVLFAANCLLSLTVLLTASYESTRIIMAFLIIYPAITGAVKSAGYHLAMSDMVLEMKKMNALEGRLDEPSLAGLFMGVNSLFCKPARSFLPVVAANMLGDLDMDSENSQDIQQTLFQVLVVPPLLFSIIEFISWRRYTLTPTRTSQMREELRILAMRQQQQQQQQQQQHHHNMDEV